MVSDKCFVIHITKGYVQDKNYAVSNRDIW